MMICKLTPPLLLAFCIGAAGDSLSGDPVNDAHALLMGAWKVVHAEEFGRKVSEDEVKKLGMVLIFDKGQLILTTADSRELKTTYRLDPAKDAKNIDLFLDPRNEKRPFPGIYKLERDTLTICFSDGAKRPADFKTQAEGHHVLVMTRVKR